MMRLSQSPRSRPWVRPVVREKCMMPRWKRWYTKSVLRGSAVGRLVGKPHTSRSSAGRAVGSQASSAPYASAQVTVFRNVVWKLTGRPFQKSGT